MNADDLKVYELKHKLNEKGLPTTGLKAELVTRLKAQEDTATTEQGAVAASNLPEGAVAASNLPEGAVADSYLPEDMKWTADDLINPGDSISHVSHTSSVYSSLARSAAKKAALTSKLKTLKEQHALEEKQEKTMRELRELKLRSELAAVAAEEEVLARYEDSLSSNKWQFPVVRPKSAPLPDPVSSDDKLSNPKYPNVPNYQPPFAGPKITKDSGLSSQPNVTTQDAGNSNTLRPQAPVFKPQVQPTQNNFLQQKQLIDMINLPKPQLQGFDGNPLDFHLFMNTFRACIDNTSISDASKLNRLFDLCKGKPLNVIKPCALMRPEEGYERAKRLLHERFGNDFVIADTWVKKLTNGPAVKGGSSEMLQDFADDARGCIETLRSMGRVDEIDTRGRMVLLVQRLPFYLQTRWRKTAVDFREQHGNYPCIDQLMLFLDRAAREATDPVFGALGKERKDNKESKAKGNNRSSATCYNVKSENDSSNEGKSRQQVCPKCSETHGLYQCDVFKQLDAISRLNFAKQKKLCFNCLKVGKHGARECRFDRKCGIQGCEMKHSRLLHQGFKDMKTKKEQATTATKDEAVKVSDVPTVVADSCACGSSFRVALPIVSVLVKGLNGKKTIKTCALLDSGSNKSFCAPSLLEELQIEGKQTNLKLATLNNGADVKALEVSLVVSSAQETKRKEHKPFVLSKVYGLQTFPKLMTSIADRDDVKSWPHLKDIPIPLCKDKVTLLIGQDYPDVLMPLEVRRGDYKEPYAVKTSLGWTINGPLYTKDLDENQGGVCNFVDSETKQLERQVEAFWKVDNAGVNAQENLSIIERKVLSIWDNSVRVVNGHYQLDVPFKSEYPSLPNNKSVAERRLMYLRKKLDGDDKLKARYSAGIEDLLKKGFAEKVHDGDEGPQGLTWYIPHHAVFNVNKPEKLRIVFDCAATYMNTALNQEVHQGPDMTNKLIGVLIRFRENPIAIMADVEAMFHQVRVTPRHRDALRFLWYKNDHLLTFRMCVHLFGGVWSPSVSSYALKRTADEHRSLFKPQVVNAVMNDFYVDDLLHSLKSEEDGVTMVSELKKLMAMRGFNLTKWVSNSRKVLQSIPEDCLAKTVQTLDLSSSNLPIERALGVVWDTENDSLCINVKTKEVKYTRRGLLSYVSSVYDPIGIVCPFALLAKKMFQNECRLKKSWDDDLEETTVKAFNKWVNELPKLKELSMDRCVIPPSMDDDLVIQLHHFADASTEAYGTVSYLRVVDSSGTINCCFMMGKSRLAPIKTLSIPRLELCAAVMAVHVNGFFLKEMRIRVHQTFFWTDSMVVLGYIRNTERRFQTFVANRLTVIHDGSIESQWRYVKSQHNPADDASRGLKADVLLSGRWLRGPDFLWLKEDMWPPVTEVTVSSDDLEIKRECQNMHVKVAVETENVSCIEKLLRYFSSYSRLQKSVAWLLKFICWLKTKQTVKTLAVEDMQRAEQAIIKYVQRNVFAKEIKELKTSAGVGKASSIYFLEPMVDEDGILRVGGRLNKAGIEETARHPMIVPRDNYVTLLLVRATHENEAKHLGTEYVMSLLRRNYWIPKGRQLIRRVVQDCVVCKRLRARPESQKMADLPEDRVTPGQPPFSNVGIDCFGPFYVKRPQ